MTVQMQIGVMEDAEDAYPSRIWDEPKVLERQDPVVYGSADDGPLSQAQLDAYDKNGYLFMEEILAEHEVQELLACVHTMKQDSSIDEDTIVREPDSQVIRSFFYVHAYQERIAALATDPRMLNIAQQLLGGDVYIHQSRINLKPGFRGKEFYWHSDFETWHVEDGMPRMRALSCSISLTPNSEFNGPLMIIPGSHYNYICCVGETPEDHYKASLRRQDYGVPDDAELTRLVDQYGILVPTGAAGSVLFFDCNLMHGSNSNITPFSRTNVFMVYNSTENVLVDPFSKQAPRPQHIAQRQDFSPVTAT